MENNTNDNKRRVIVYPIARRQLLREWLGLPPAMYIVVVDQDTYEYKVVKKPKRFK